MVLKYIDNKYFVTNFTYVYTIAIKSFKHYVFNYITATAFPDFQYLV